MLFHELDLSVAPGQSLAILGPSGSGKTTLLSCIAGLAAPTAGEVLIAGAPPERAARSAIATVLQGHALVSLLTARENIEVLLRSEGRRPADARHAAIDMLAGVGLADYVDHLVEELSGGQQQRVAVARALAVAPAVVVADEPTTEQDKQTRMVVLDHLFTVPRRGGALILATHDLAVAERCDDALVLGRERADSARH